MPKTDTMDDLQAPGLRQRLVRYIGLQEMARAGNATRAQLHAALRDLELACRAADRIIDMMAKPHAERVRRLLAPGRN